MSSTITAHTNSWTIEYPGTAGLVGAAFNATSAVIDENNVVTIQNQLGTLWSGPISTLSGLTGGTPLALYEDLLDSFIGQYP